MIKVTANMGAIAARIQQVTERSTRGVLDVMREERDNAMDLVRDFVPVDEGNLEDAIRKGETPSGPHGRHEVDVYIDMNHPAPHFNADGSITKGTEGKVTGDYALQIHEDMSYQLGPKSQEKNTRLGGGVGPKFMDRALDEIEGRLLARAREKVRKATRS